MVDAIAKEWVADVDDMLGEEIAVGDGEFYISDAETGKRRIRSAETNLGDFVADGIYAYFNEIEELHCDIAVMNGGGIRADVPAGAWSFKTCKMVSLYFMPYWAFSGQRKVARHASGSPYGGAGAKRLRGQGRYRKTKTQR